MLPSRVLTTLLVLLLFAVPAQARITFGVVPAANGLFRSEAQALEFSRFLSGYLKEEVSVQVFKTETKLHDWMNRYRMVDMGILSDAYLASYPPGEFFPLADYVPSQTPQKTSPNLFVARQGLNPWVLQKLQRLIPTLGESAEGRQALGLLQIFAMVPPGTSDENLAPHLAAPVAPAPELVAPEPASSLDDVLERVLAETDSVGAEPEPAPEPVRGSEPEALRQPAPEPATAIAPEPTEFPEPPPVPQPEVAPAPAAVSVSEPVPVPAPEPEPAPEPAPEPLVPPVPLVVEAVVEKPEPAPEVKPEPQLAAPPVAAKPPPVAAKPAVPKRSEAPRVEEALMAMPVVASEGKAIAGTQKSYLVEPVANTIYAALSRPGGHATSNAFFAVGPEYVVAGGAHMSKPAVDDLVKAIQTVTEKPLRYFILAHHHRGFSHIDFDFPAGVDLLISWQTWKAMEGEIRKPNRPLLFFSDGMTLKLGEQSIILTNMGQAHTEGDTLVFFPEAEVLFTSDLVYVKSVGYMGDAQVEDWLLALEFIERLGAKRVIPGFGPVSPSSDIAKFKDFFRDLVTEVLKHLERGDSVEQTLKSLSLSEYSHYSGYQQFLPANVRRIYQNLAEKHFKQ